ncbi:DNA-3-methyladenine glycosylase 2 [Psychrobacillus lasiicapitis]|uniref:DNA-3-methyladenine glycosylase II n=1 Tax=Psychrobacillus lasiicapitis TaxID=1636719 RepID=A0A544T513_9BACI|nr:DNA-3-methyladenine glycosylase [Psychrobacillus lasiicapitis]TQR12540.1 DNA-3-methyladenine glycosylase 2 family protein [Psychrobacillus lasiicapitis]GGA38955.1 DNA-3-methyladenine glycosylase [Psychrobacillus lasiicapitis]
MLWEEKEELILLKTPPEFSFTQNLHYLSRSTNECLYRIHDNKIRKAIIIGTCTTLVEIGEQDKHTLLIEFLGSTRPSSKRVREQVVAYIIEWLDLKTDINTFYEVAKNDPILNQAILQFRGLRIMGISDLFEAMAWGILGQQINLTYAYTLKRRLVEKFGHWIEFEGEQYWLFPNAKDIAKLTVDDLVEIKMTVKKCEYLIEVATQIDRGLLTKEMLLETKDVKKAEKILTKIRGIGPWTANYVLMRCLRFPDAFPIDDVGLHNAIKYVIGSELKPTKDVIQQLALPWKGWEAYATFYLWRFLY